MYHRIHETTSDPWSLCISPDRFAEHLEVLTSAASVVPLTDLSKALRAGKLPDRCIAVTFDDGYADNLLNARPLLERHGVPATVFVATGQLDSEREFWWDELERLMLRPGGLPDRLSLTINGSTDRWLLEQAAVYTDEDIRRDRDLQAWEGAVGSRLDLYRSLWELLQPLPQCEQHAVLDQLLKWAGQDSGARATHRTLSVDEARSLTRDDLVTLGAHTLTHPKLSEHSLQFQRNEIVQSKARLEQITGKPVTNFAYPYGNYTRASAKLTKAAGFDTACTTVAASVWRYTDPLLLPRLAVENWDGEEFNEKLTRYLRRS